MSTAYSSGLSALIQAATSQLGDLEGGGGGGGGEEETNTMEAGTVTMDASVSGGGSSSSSSSRSIPTTPTLECEYYSRGGVSDLDLDGNNNNRYYAAAAAAAAATAATVVTPLLTSISSYQHQHQHQHQGITSGGIVDRRTTSSSPSTTFPMILMNLLINPAYEDIVTFLPDGKYFAIRRVDFTDLLLYNNFHLLSFNDFLELIIRWGFIRVDNGNNINIKADNNGNNDNNNNNNNSSNHWADIYVFRHPHFGMNQPVDMNKIKVRNVDMAVLPQIALQKCMREELTNTSSSSSYSKNKKSVETTNTNNNNNNNNKRQLSEDFYHHQRSSSSSSSSTNDDKSTTTPIFLDPIYLSSSSNENYRDQTAQQQQQQLRRRSSLELRSVAQAITASKLQLLHGCGGELVKESDIGSNNDYPGDNSSALYHYCADHQQQERRQSTTSTTNLVDGGVETATQNIVTDAIEALLFDESHTRDTFMRHEKELSVSSLPGVVPITMQLFSENNDDDGKSSDTSSSSPSNSNDRGSKSNKSLGSCSRKKDRKSSTSSSSSKDKPKRKANGKGRRKTSSSLSSSKLQSSWEINTTCAINSSLEDASRNNDVTNADTDTDTDTGSTPEKLRVVIPPNDNSPTRQQRYVGSMMVVSPARMEAAAALVSQSRYNRTDGEFS